MIPGCPLKILNKPFLVSDCLWEPTVLLVSLVVDVRVEEGVMGGSARWEELVLVESWLVRGGANMPPSVMLHIKKVIKKNKVIFIFEVFYESC